MRKFEALIQEALVPAPRGHSLAPRAFGPAVDEAGLAVYRALTRARPKAEGSFLLVREPAQALVGVEPFETIRCRPGDRRDPFKLLARRMKGFSARRDPRLPDFQGGAFGYFAYDAVRYREPRALAGLPVARDGYDAELMLFRKLVSIEPWGGDGADRLRIVAACGFIGRGAPTAAQRSRANAEAGRLLDEALEALATIQAAPAPAPRASARRAARAPASGKGVVRFPNPARFLGGVKRLKRHIREGDIFQAVLSDGFEAPCALEASELFALLSRSSPAPYRFLFEAGERAYLGASPEMLLRARGGNLETHPIAGTRPRGSTPAQEKKLERQLQRSPKERAEHLMLVDLARNDLGRVSRTGSVRVEAFGELHKYAGVMHLVSRVSGRLAAGLDAVEALASCFPAGTLSGAPKIRAMQLIGELEGKARGFYGGALVAASFTGDLDSCIAIRSLELSKGRARFRAGAGVVADSRPEAELAEILGKSRMIREALAAAAAGASGRRRA